MSQIFYETIFPSEYIDVLNCGFSLPKKILVLEMESSTLVLALECFL